MADEYTHVVDDDKMTAVDVLKVMCMSGGQQEGFYVMDGADIVRKYHEWVAKMPRVKPFYAVKCNSDTTALQILVALGVGFDCASQGEIAQLLKMGVAPHRIVFANPTKMPTHLSYAAAQGVDLMTFDCDTELLKVKSLYPKARLLLRIRSDAKAAYYHMSNKHGCDPVTEAPRLLQTARNLGLTIVGVSFHVGSGCDEPFAFRRAIAAARQLFDLGETLGFKMNLLNIGGGFPGERGTSMNQIVDVVNSALADLFPSDDVTVIAEPGRYFVGSAFSLATRIYSIKQLALEDKPSGKELGDTEETHFMYFIDVGIYTGFMSTLAEWNEPYVATPLKVRGVKLAPSSVWGPTCDGGDRVIDNVLLPPMLIGDWFLFENMGAYTLSTCSTFNGFPIPKVHAVVPQSVWNLLQGKQPIENKQLVESLKHCHISNGNEKKAGVDVHQ